MKFVVAIALVAVLAVVLALFLALPVMWAWNYTVPGIFHLPAIGWLQAFCLTFLCATFFKGASSSSSK